MLAAKHQLCVTASFQAVQGEARQKENVWVTRRCQGLPAVIAVMLLNANGSAHKFQEIPERLYLL